MLLTPRELPVLIANALYIPAFTVVALRTGNIEFLLYVAVVLVVGGLILWKQRTVRFGLPILWGLTLWGLLHMAGGNIRVGGGVLYGFQLIPRYLKFDQFVHCLGFGVATLVCHHLLRPLLREGAERRTVVYLLVLLMGTGFGAMNEIIEFVAVLTMPETGVGGYDNTMWDLAFNLLGAVLAVSWVAWRDAVGARAAGRGRAKVSVRS